MLAGFVVPPQLAIGVPSVIYNGPPAGQVGVVNVLFCNLGGTGLVQFSIAISRAASANTISIADWITYERWLIEGGEYEKCLLQIFPGEKVWVKANSASVSARAHGYERVAVGGATNAAPAANVLVPLYTAPVNRSASGNVLVVNRTNQVVRPQIAITTAAANVIPNSAWVTSRFLAGNGEYEKMGLTVMPGETVFYRSDSAGTNVRGHFSLGDV